MTTRKRALSSAAKYALHATRKGFVSRMNLFDDNTITDATMNALVKRGLVTIAVRACDGSWSVAQLTDEGRQAYAAIDCGTCRGSRYMPDPENDWSGITCTTCRGARHMK